MSVPLAILLGEASDARAALLRTLIDATPDMRVVGHARDGLEAVALAARLRPDVIAMDADMPGLDGLAATKRIMSECPTPIVIVSATVDEAQVGVSIAALSAGALAVVEKPVGPGAPRHDELARRLLVTLRAMAGMKLVRRHESGARARDRAPAPDGPPRGGSGRTVVAVAASTGGPAALGRILAALPPGFPAPLLVVQHIAPGFVDGLATWLDMLGPLAVKVAVDGEALEPGHAYLAADGRHLGISGSHRIQYSDAAPVGGFRPAATWLFESIAHAAGTGAIGIVLTGMGRDGVEGLRALRAAGGRVVVQDAASAVVNGMPGAAVAAGLADAVVPLPRMAEHLRQLVVNRP